MVKAPGINKIPFLDLKRQHETLKNELREAMQRVMEDAAFSGGPFVERFEKEFADFCNTKFAIALNSGTSALHLALRALGVQPGDEVLVPANTFIATAWGVSHTGATPVFVDCDAATWTLSPEQAKAKITPRTKAIIGVHLYGQPCEIDGLQKICHEQGIHFIEDAAQAHGAAYRGKKAGGFGEMACFSFYPGKNLGALGEGGGVTTNNLLYADKIKLLRNQGSVVKYYHEEIGYNERMDGIQGAVLSVKLKYLEQWNQRRKEIAEKYRQGIKHAGVKMQMLPGYMESANHLFVITVEKRDTFMKYLNERNIFPGLHYPVPCHLQNAYAHLQYKQGDCPNAEYLSEHCVSLPMFPELKDEEVEYVIEIINRFAD